MRYLNRTDLNPLLNLLAITIAILQRTGMSAMPDFVDFLNERRDPRMNVTIREQVCLLVVCKVLNTISSKTSAWMDDLPQRSYVCCVRG